ncbi:MAG: putative Holliday junction resolvase [Candidatus Saccharibacteria bacterium]|nr:putative Holliday junction resolvase [Candidatus Saccharibacteria bacterium]
MPPKSNVSSSIIALDVGERRIGVARASLIARLPEPLTTLERGESSLQDIKRLVDEQAAEAVVVGLPRGLQGQDTQQTMTTQAFIAMLIATLAVPVHTQDEAVTSVKAEAELVGRKVPYNKGDVDALAATYILEDYLSTHHS